MRIRRRTICRPTAAPSTRRAHPRINVVGARRGRSRIGLPSTSTATSTSSRRRTDGPSIRSAAKVRDGRIYGRGACDMKAGIAAAIYAAEAIRRAGVDAARARSRSAARVDEESGGFAGVAWLARHGRLSSRSGLDSRHHPRAAQRRSDLHRPSRRLLVRGSDARTHRARQHAVPRRQRHRAHGRSSSSACERELLPALAAREHGDAGRPGRRASRDAERQRDCRRAAGRTASRRRASPTPAGRSSIGASCSRKASSGHARRSRNCSRARRRGNAEPRATSFAI